MNAERCAVCGRAIRPDKWAYRWDDHPGVTVCLPCVADRYDEVERIIGTGSPRAARGKPRGTTRRDVAAERLVDPGAGCEHLYDLGPVFRLAWSVGPDGDAWPTVVDTRVTGSHYVPCRPEHFLELAPHELTGRLPQSYRDALGQVSRCGAPTRTTGKPCRIVVSAPGQHCGAHSDPTV